MAHNRLTITEHLSSEYAWTPPGLSSHQIVQYFSLLPQHKVPYLNSQGERYRVRQLLYQLPPQDSEPRYCCSLTVRGREELQLFLEQRKRQALGRGTVRLVDTSGRACDHCLIPLRVGDLSVVASKAGPYKCWHPGCFVCTVCRELLVDLIYFYYNGSQLLCGRHYGEKIKPRCIACDELIFADECTEAEGHTWHLDHFTCSHCDCVLAGSSYILHDQLPFCVVCYNQLLCNYCSSCAEPIAITQGQMSHRGQYWHSNPRCFSCQTCRKHLLGRPFLPDRGRIFCSLNCAAATSDPQNRTSGPSPSSSSEESNLSNVLLPAATVSSYRDRQKLHSPAARWRSFRRQRSRTIQLAPRRRNCVIL